MAYIAYVLTVSRGEGSARFENCLEQKSQLSEGQSARPTGRWKARVQEAASVVVCQAQSVVAGDQAVSGGIHAQSVGPRLPYQADEQFPVGDTVTGRNW